MFDSPWDHFLFLSAKDDTGTAAEQLNLAEVSGSNPVGVQPR
jgi:hypothetical protein